MIRKKLRNKVYTNKPKIFTKGKSEHSRMQRRFVKNRANAKSQASKLGKQKH